MLNLFIYLTFFLFFCSQRMKKIWLIGSCIKKEEGWHQEWIIWIWKWQSKKSIHVLDARGQNKLIFEHQHGPLILPLSYLFNVTLSIRGDLYAWRGSAPLTEHVTPMEQLKQRSKYVWPQPGNTRWKNTVRERDGWKSSRCVWKRGRVHKSIHLYVRSWLPVEPWTHDASWI